MAKLPEHQSIFGDTYGGVANPLVPHAHPYATRFHGPMNATVRFGMPFQRQTYVGYSGFGFDLPGTCPGDSYWTVDGCKCQANSTLTASGCQCNAGYTASMDPKYPGCVPKAGTPAAPADTCASMYPNTVRDPATNQCVCKPGFLKDDSGKFCIEEGTGIRSKETPAAPPPTTYAPPKPGTTTPAAPPPGTTRYVKPTQKQEEDNTLLYVGVGAAALLVLYGLTR